MGIWKKEKITDSNSVSADVIRQDAVPEARDTSEKAMVSEIPSESTQLELLQILSKRAVRDAEELAGRIEKASMIRAEAESAARSLKEEAERQAQETVGKARKDAEDAAEETSAKIIQKATQF